MRMRMRRALSVLADLVAYNAANGSATYRTQYTTASDGGTCDTAYAGTGDGATLTMAHAVPGRAACHGDCQQAGKTQFQESIG